MAKNQKKIIRVVENTSVISGAVYDCIFNKKSTIIIVGDESDKIKIFNKIKEILELICKTVKIKNVKIFDKLFQIKYDNFHLISVVMENGIVTRNVENVILWKTESFKNFKKTMSKIHFMTHKIYISFNDLS